MAVNTNSFIHFRKTNSVDFAQEFPEFNEWLYKKDEEGNYVNIEPIGNGNFKLSRKREKEFPTFQNVTVDSSLNNAYFLDDIKVIYYRGVPYDSASDYITSAEYTDSDELSVDENRHVLLIPKTSTQNNVAYLHQLDETGVYNPNVADSSITILVNSSQKGKTFTIKQSMVKGSASDSTDAISYYGLKNYIDSKFKNAGIDEVIDTEWKDEV